MVTLNGTINVKPSDDHVRTGRAKITWGGGIFGKATRCEMWVEITYFNHDPQHGTHENDRVRKWIPATLHDVCVWNTYEVTVDAGRAP